MRVIATLGDGMSAESMFGDGMSAESIFDDGMSDEGIAGAANTDSVVDRNAAARQARKLRAGMPGACRLRVVIRSEVLR
jgi:hypothetical protein